MGQKSVLLAIILIVLAVVLAIVFVISRVRGGGDSTPVPTPLETRRLIDVNSVVFNPLVFSGQTVEIESNVSDWITNRSFTIAQPRSALGSRNPELLLISQNQFKLPENAGDTELGLGELGRVKIRGRVEILNRTQLEDRLGVDIDSPEFALDDNTIEEWELGPVVLVNFVEKL